ncbi:Tigger transposable element-derived protein 6 [Araneus ventricosus]|uniref:Tigger transposable element-derived protein 6 n=1 Tax=Araneus ventricosus TaxID=182803 RepID=A0A4Y2TP71_ARAVE|nr:Tigger transposable element-derived protein 6 [Araneus ventricosus]
MRLAFYRGLPDKTLCFKGEKCSSGKISKERLTLLLCCNMLGDFETPVVIGKAKKPRCFKNIDVRKLSVSWKSNKKAWMTTEIMSDWMVELDNKMKKQKRKIILLMDNATSHPDDLKLKNINLVFLPPDTTSMLQPLDQGIIRSFKVGYRKLLLRHVLSQISSCKSSEELAKSVSVLDAISWITSALKKVEPGCVLKCFKKAGFLSTSEVTTVSTTEKREKELADLVANLDSNVSVEEYVKIDDDLSIEEEKMHVFNCIHRDTTEALALSEDDDGESPIEDCKIKYYSAALKKQRTIKTVLSEQ